MLLAAVCITIGGTLMATFIAVSWTLFFAFVLPWSGHAWYLPLPVMVGGTAGALLGLYACLRCEDAGRERAGAGGSRCRTPGRKPLRRRAGDRVRS